MGVGSGPSDGQSFPPAGVLGGPKEGGRSGGQKCIPDAASIAPEAAHAAPADARLAQSGGGEAALPCLNSHNSTCPQAVALTSGARRTAFALGLNVAAMVAKHGIERVGFLTLTFRDHVLCPKVAQARFNSLSTHVLSERYASWLRVVERQKSGRIHYHVLVAVRAATPPGGADIRTGCDFAAFERRDYSSAPAALRAEWAFWRRTAPAFGFGRTELLPVMSSAVAIGKYVGKYISKHLDAREERDKGIRLVAYSRAAKIASTRFAWASPGAAEWRRKLGELVREFHTCGRIHSPSFEGMRFAFGPRWAYRWADSIHGVSPGHAGVVHTSEPLVAVSDCGRSPASASGLVSYSTSEKKGAHEVV